MGALVKSSAMHKPASLPESVPASSGFPLSGVPESTYFPLSGVPESTYFPLSGVPESSNPESGFPLSVPASTTVFASTNISADPVTPAMLASIVDFPTDNPVTTPSADTLATAGSEEVHVTDDVMVSVDLTPFALKLPTAVKLSVAPF